MSYFHQQTTPKNNRWPHFIRHHCREGRSLGRRLPGRRVVALPGRYQRAAHAAESQPMRAPPAFTRVFWISGTQGGRCCCERATVSGRHCVESFLVVLDKLSKPGNQWWERGKVRPAITRYKVTLFPSISLVVSTLSNGAVSQTELA